MVLSGGMPSPYREQSPQTQQAAAAHLGFARPSNTAGSAFAPDAGSSGGADMSDSKEKNFLMAVARQGVIGASWTAGMQPPFTTAVTGANSMRLGGATPGGNTPAIAPSGELACGAVAHGSEDGHAFSSGGVGSSAVAGRFAGASHFGASTEQSGEAVGCGGSALSSSDGGNEGSSGCSDQRCVIGPGAGVHELGVTGDESGSRASRFAMSQHGQHPSRKRSCDDPAGRRGEGARGGDRARFVGERMGLTDQGPFEFAHDYTHVSPLGWGALNSLTGSLSAEHASSASAGLTAGSATYLSGGARLAPALGAAVLAHGSGSVGLGGGGTVMRPPLPPPQPAVSQQQQHRYCGSGFTGSRGGLSQMDWALAAGSAASQRHLASHSTMAAAPGAHLNLPSAVPMRTAHLDLSSGDGMGHGMSAASVTRRHASEFRIGDGSKFEATRTSGMTQSSMAHDAFGASPKCGCSVATDAASADHSQHAGVGSGGDDSGEGSGTEVGGEVMHLDGILDMLDNWEQFEQPPFQHENEHGIF